MRIFCTHRYHDPIKPVYDRIKCAYNGIKRAYDQIKCVNTNTCHDVFLQKNN